MSLSISGHSQVSVSISTSSQLELQGRSSQHGVRGGGNSELVNAAANMLMEFTKFALDALQKAGGAMDAGKTGGTSGSPDLGQSGNVSQCGCHHTPSEPSPSDASHPEGSLKTDDSGVVTTPGGYKIEATGQFDWKITGPDGKETKVWGDPHVAEGDGGKWDFKKDSTFVLGDGTRINCSVTPYGNGATVTKGLEIISGNDRAQINDIDKGKGKTSAVTQDGFAHVNSFGGKDVFVMGKETDDWSSQGKEIIGSDNQGETLKLGNDLAAGTGAKPTDTKPTDTKPNTKLDQILDLFRNLSKVFDSLKNLTKALTDRSKQNTGIVPQGHKEPVAHRRGFLERAFSNIGRMLDTVARFQNLSQSITANRNQFTA